MAVVEALSRSGGGAARLRVREPAGERTFCQRVTLGGTGADIVVPGAPPGAALRIERRSSAWTVDTLGTATVSLDGRELGAVRDLRLGDVLRVGEAQAVVSTLAREELSLSVLHLVGNDTVPPAATLVPWDAPLESDLDIAPVAPPPFTPEPALVSGVWSRAQFRAVATALWRQQLRGRLPWLVALAIFLGLLHFLSQFHAVTLDVLPRDAQVRVSDTWLAVRTGDTLWLRAGSHTLRAERRGYFPARADVRVFGDSRRLALARLSLAKLPGRVRIDTGGVAARVSIDGIERGTVPGELDVPAGRRTLTLRAPRYLDAVRVIDVAGAQQLQRLSVRLQPAWGTLILAPRPTDATLSIDGIPQPSALAPVELPAGVHRIRLSAPGLAPWESSLVIRAGETLRTGSLVLGQAPGQLVLRSHPEGASVSIARTWRGRTPLSLQLPSGLAHEVLLAAPGYDTWTRTVQMQPATRLALDVALRPILFDVSVRGAPQDAEIFVDGQSRGRAPQTLRLLAIEHRIELRKPGFVPFITSVAPAPGIDRSVSYQLVPGASR